MVLTPQALQLLVNATDEAWEKANGTKRMSLQKQAELLGSTKPTIKKVFNHVGVDKTTLILAFKSVGLDWSDDYCQRFEDEILISGSPNPEGRGILKAIVEVPSQRRHLHWIYYLVLASVVVVAYAFLREKPAYVRDSDSEVRHVTELLDSGYEFYEHAQYDRARAVVNEARELATKHDIAGEMASALRLTAWLDVQAGQYELAEKNFKDAILLKYAIRNKGARYPLYEELADVQTLMGRFHDARASLKTAQAGYENMKDPNGVGLVLRDLGSVCYQEGKYGEAMDCFTRAKQKTCGDGKRATDSDINARLALVYSKQHRFSEARALLSNCMEYWKKEKNHARWIATTNLQMGQVEEDAGNFETARHFYLFSQSGFEDLGDNGGLRKVSAGLDRIQHGLAR